MQTTIGRLTWRTLAHRPSIISHQISSRFVSPSRYRIRRFHASRQLGSPILDSCCIQIHDALVGLHTFTGLPWLLTIPVAAVLVKSTIALPFTVLSRISMQRSAMVRPLVLAWGRIIVDRVIKENMQLGPEVCKKLADASRKEKQMELFKTFGVRRWPAFTPIFQLPIFLVIMETMRRMCGVSGGLLSSLFKSLGSGEDTMGIPVETTMATEGGLWFPDLLAPDPMLILPATLSVLLFTNVSESSNLSERTNVTESRSLVVIRRSLKLVALAIFPAALNLPTGMLLYWISSAAVAALTNATLRFALPLQSSPVPCKPSVAPYKKDLTGKN